MIYVVTPTSLLSLDEYLQTNTIDQARGKAM